MFPGIRHMASHSIILGAYDDLRISNPVPDTCQKQGLPQARHPISSACSTLRISTHRETMEVDSRPHKHNVFVLIPNCHDGTQDTLCGFVSNGEYTPRGNYAHKVTCSWDMETMPTK